MRTVLAHVLYVAVHALLELPVGADFRSLLVGKVSEGTALADAVATLDLLQTLGVQRCLAVVVVGLGRLERIRSFSGLQVLDLAANSAPASHYLLDLSVGQHA